MNKLLTWALVIAGIGGGYVLLSNIPREPQRVEGVLIPDLTAQAALGEAVFQGTCAACHGVKLEGTDSGPPLVLPVYRPAMHADFAFTLAIQNGVVAHHWGFGNMPPQEAIAAEDISRIIAYVREVQRANGVK